MTFVRFNTKKNTQNTVTVTFVTRYDVRGQRSWNSLPRRGAVSPGISLPVSSRPLRIRRRDREHLLAAWAPHPRRVAGERRSFAAARAHRVPGAPLERDIERVPRERDHRPELGPHRQGLHVLAGHDDRLVIDFDHGVLGSQADQGVPRATAHAAIV